MKRNVSFIIVALTNPAQQIHIGIDGPRRNIATKIDDQRLAARSLHCRTDSNVPNPKHSV